jgi:hypothetical protein
MMAGIMDILSVCPLRAASLLWQPRLGTWAMTVVCKATFRLSPVTSSLAESQEYPNEDDNHWNDDPARSLHAPSDLAPFKPSPEVMLVGHAFAPRGEPVARIVARLIVGEVDKSIEAHADESWSLDGARREGQRFTKMPLRWERAAGGPDSANPVGVRVDVANTLGATQLPNLRPPGVSIATRGEFVPPVGFGPIAPTWPSRREKLARLARPWSGSFASEPLPEGLDPLYFMAAPRDQALAALRADERIVLENLHLEHPRLATNLPGLEPRVFIDAPSHSPWELKLTCDTLWIDTDRSLCTLTWRGQAQVDGPTPAGRMVVAMERVGRTLAWAQVEPQLRARHTLQRSETLDDGHTHASDPDPVSAAGLPFATPLTASSVAAPAASPASTPLAPLHGDWGEGTVPTRSHMLAALGPAWLDPKGARPAPPAPPVPVPPLAQPAPPAPTVAGAAPLQPQPVAPETSASPWAARAPGIISFGAAPPVPVPAAVQPAPTFAPVPAPAPSVPAYAPIPAPAPSTPGYALAPAEGPVVAPSPRASLASAGSAMSWLTSPRYPEASPPPEVKKAETTVEIRDAARRGVVAASNAAASGGATSNATAAPAARDASEARAREAVGGTQGAREHVDVVWFDAPSIPRVRMVAPSPAQGAGVSWLKSDPDGRAETQELKDRRDALRVLAGANALDDTGVTAAIAAAFRDDGSFEPPLVLVTGELCVAFDAVEALKATITVTTPFLGGDKKLREVLGTATDALKSELTDDVAEGLTARIEEAFAQGSRSVAPGYVQAGTERILLEGRRYQHKTLLGEKRIRALFTVAGAQAPTPAYLPDAAGAKLPIFRRFRARAVVEVRPQEDQYESHRDALVVLALGRSLRDRRSAG